MEELYQRIFDLALPYLEKGVRKDLVTHTKWVVNCMEILLKNEKGNRDILIPAATLHDVGWAKVPENIQLNWRNKEDKIRGEKLHLEYAGPIIKEILGKVNYNPSQIQEIIEIVRSHKYQNPSKLEKQLLIDADKMSDSVKEQFYSDVKFYKSNPEKIYEFRNKNEFYTETGKAFFENEMAARKKEFESS